METVAHRSPQDKPALAWHCSYLGLAGILTRPDGHCLFLEAQSGAVIHLSEVDVYRDVVMNGRVDVSMEQLIADLVEGRAAKVCSREEGRA